VSRSVSATYDEDRKTSKERNISNTAEQRVANYRREGRAKYSENMPKW